MASASPGAPAPALPVLVSRDSADGDNPVQVELNELQVDGRVTRLTFTARNRAPVAAPGEVPNNWQVADFLSDGVAQKDGAAPDDAFSVDGVYLLDGAGAKRYLVARNASDGCVCSGDLSRTFVAPGSGVVLTAIFAALPAGVAKVDVVVPKFGSFSGVPVSR